MKITPAKQSTLAPSDKPLVERPVMVAMDIPLFYARDGGKYDPWKHAVFCAEDFGFTVLSQLNSILGNHQMGMVHIGFYNPRKARGRNGVEFTPARWSNHAYGTAVDFKGVVTGGTFYGIKAMKKTMPAVLSEIVNGCGQAITILGKKPEIVDEGDWLHIGIWPRARS